MDVRQRIRELSDDGRLSWPWGAYVRFATGDGTECHICGTPITASTRQATMQGPAAELRLHVACLRSWVEELAP